MNRIAAAARDALGYAALRPGQREAVEAVLAGRDALVVLPTGAGKSAVYQLAGHLTTGGTLVVSPLVALQRDQVDSLAALDAGDAAAVNAMVGAADRREAFEAWAAGTLEFLLVAPEQLANPRVRELVRRRPPSLLVVDEAHCVSAWGHDFRPDYLRLGELAEDLGRPTILALTATASPPVREDVVEALRMRDPVVVVRGFDRPNIHLAVSLYADEGAKRDALLSRVVAAPKPGLVYVATRSSAEDLAWRLAAEGLRVNHYHAGMRVRYRRQVQDVFMTGELDVVVATNAFGMGIDKADVRFVHHYEVSDSLDSYYQEIGRAGRDGEPADAELFYRPADLGLRRFHASGRVPEEAVRAVAAGELDGLSARRVTAARNLLDLGGGTVEGALRAAERRRAVERSRVDMMRAYAETTGCRRALLLSYFGEPADGACGRCDTCESGSATVAGAGPYAVSSRVAHPEWGEGVVLRYEDADKVVVLFDDVGYKTLSLAAVEENGLLRRAG